MKIVVAPLAGARIEIPLHTEADTVYLSLPSRERGLKYCTGYRGTRSRWSLPSRERGLKCIYQKTREVIEQSLPSRERGLKYIQSILFYLP